MMIGKIFQAIPEIMSEMGAIAKDRDNKQQGFKFRGIDDVYNELHGRLAKHKVFSVPEVLEERREQVTSKSGTNLTYVILKIKYTFFCDDGSSFSATVIGEGMDSGDKASNKAQAVAHKYALLQIFAIPTEDEKDPDAESHEVKGETQPPQKDIFKEEREKKAAAAKDPSLYVFTYGKYKGRPLNQIPALDIKDYVSYIKNQAERNNKPLQGAVLESITMAESYLRTKFPDPAEPPAPELGDIPF